MSLNTCMITGHRKISLTQIPHIHQELERIIISAVESGYTHFISGFAEGADLLFADIVVELKARYPITLEAALPYRNRINTKDCNFQKLITQCDEIGIHSEMNTFNCYKKRNQYMVRNADLIIAVYDGRKSGGTYSTLQYAKILAKPIKIIFPQTP
ncbi:MAG: SLOG family protein [Clostridia bacterium]